MLCQARASTGPTFDPGLRATGEHQVLGGFDILTSANFSGEQPQNYVKTKQALNERQQCPDVGLSYINAFPGTATHWDIQL